jgi:hypothetical protein
MSYLFFCQDLLINRGYKDTEDEIPPLPFIKERNYPSLANGSTRLAILSLSKERGKGEIFHEQRVFYMKTP